MRTNTFAATVAALALLSLAAAQTYAPTYEGCILAADVPEGNSTGAQASSSDCAASCDTDYAYFLTSGGDCICSDTGPALGTYADGASSSGGCASTANYQAFKVSSTFVFQACVTNWADDLGLKHVSAGTETSFEECLAYCADRGTAYVGPLTLNNGEWDVWCETSYTDPVFVTCGSDESLYYAYTHSTVATASGLTRRRRRNEQSQMQQLRLEAERKPCPAGMEACSIPGSDTFECIDPLSELEACGGCQTGYWDDTRVDAPGTDCTALPGILNAAVSCLNGTCEVYECQEGWQLIEGHCIELSDV